MSWYNKEDFEYVFAVRTKKNLEFIERRYQDEKDEGKSDDEITDVFEVTQLLNSFMGLLVFPREGCFDNLPDNAEFEMGSEGDEILKKLRNDKDCYHSTYRCCIKNGRNKTYYEEYEELTPKVLALRLRNAVSHKRLEILPIKCRTDNKIDGFIFRDDSVLYGRFDKGMLVKEKPNNDVNKISQSFFIKLSIKEIRALLYSLSDLLLSQY